ncbi:MBL fold metallo-hydrolase [soil metagenome]
MSDIAFDRDFDPVPGLTAVLSPLVRRVVCDNPGPFTFKGTSTYIVGRGEVAIIDPGPSDEAHLAALLAAVAGETVSHILVTHTHMDHAPLAAELQKHTGAPILAYAIPENATADDEGHRLDAAVARDFVPDVVLADGQVVEGKGWTLETVFTPGHMSSHAAYALKEERSLFSGDHVMAWATSVIAPPDGNMGQYFWALRRLLEREDDIYYPGHGPEKRNPKPLVRAFLAHRRMREEAIIKRIRENGATTIPDIVKTSYAGLDPRLYGAAGLSTLAHIEHLIEQGRVSAVEGSGADGLYRLTA